MSTAYFYLTKEGEQLARRLAASHPGDLYNKENFKVKLQEAFHKYDYLVCIMATGIVVRILAPLIVHKTSDPGVVVLDQKGRYAISLLSGHLGGANDLAREMAVISGGEAVITTATDVAGELSFDTFAKKHHMSIENIGQLKHISGALLDGRPIRVITNKIYPELIPGSVSASPAASSGNPHTAGEFISDKAEDKNTEKNIAKNSSNREIKKQTKEVHDSKMDILTIREAKELLSTQDDASSKDSAETSALPTVVIDEGFTFPDQPAFPVLYLRPRTICAGIGCKRHMDAAAIEEALLTVLKKEGLSPLSLKCISTIPLKANEPGILTTASLLNVPLTIVSTADIEALDIDSLGIQTSCFVAEQTGVLSVSTASAYLASGKGRILRDKVKFKGITVALCQSEE